MDREIVWNEAEQAQRLRAMPAEQRTAQMLRAVTIGDVWTWEVLRSTCRRGVRDRDGNTMLMLAAQGGHVDLVQQLLQRGVSPRATNQQGETALMLASTQGQVPVVERLIPRSQVLRRCQAGLNAFEHGWRSTVGWKEPYGLAPEEQQRSTWVGLDRLAAAMPKRWILRFLGQQTDHPITTLALYAPGLHGLWMTHQQTLLRLHSSIPSGTNPSSRERL